MPVARAQVLGSFADKQNAERLAATVAQNGFPTYLTPLEQQGKTLYRVRVGPRVLVRRPYPTARARPRR